MGQLSKSLFPNNMSLTMRISLTGVLIALAVICQKVVAINYIEVIPFLRLSIGGPAIIIFASVFLGPIFGLAVGTISDVIGYFFFDLSHFPYFFQITLIYSLLGFASYYVFKLFSLIKNRKLLLIGEISFVSILALCITIFLFLIDEFQLYGTSYNLALYQRISIAAIIISLSILLIICIIIRNNKYERLGKDSFIHPVNISFSLLICEIFIMVIFGTLMKGWAFGFATYGAILLCQIITLFFNVILNTVVLQIMFEIAERKFGK